MKNLIIMILFALSVLPINATDWKIVSEYPEGLVHKIICPDSNNCFAFLKIPDGFKLYKSTDQGRTWNLKHEDSYWLNPSMYATLNASDFEVPDTNTVIVIYSDRLPIIKKSIDGGQTFNNVQFSEESYSLRKLSMYDKNVGIALGDGFKRFITYDGWQSTEELVDSLNFAGNLVFIDSHNLLCWGYSIDNYIPQLYKYNIYNKKTEIVSEFKEEKPIPINLIKFEYINDTLAFVAGSRSNGVGNQRTDVILRTMGSMSEWEIVLEREVTPIFGLLDIAFYDDKNGVALGQGGKILMTNDGGYTWHYEIPSEIYRGRDARYGPFNMKLAWAGRTPIFGTSGGNLYRYEGDFFKFTEKEEEIELSTPIISSELCNSFNLDTNIKLYWFPVDGTEHYRVEISNSLDFSGNLFLFDTTIATELLVPNLLTGERYYWRVMAIRNQVQSNWSDTCSFTTRLNSVNNLAPICGDTIYQNNVNLAWEKSTNNIDYVVEFSHDAQFITKILSDTTKEIKLTINNLTMDTIYYWRVKAINSFTESLWTEICNFHTKTISSVENSITNKFQIHPNPAKEKLTIKLLELLDLQQNYSILDLNGNVIFKGDVPLGAEQFDINLSNLVSGTYFLQIGSSQAKFIKE